MASDPPPFSNNTHERRMLNKFQVPEKMNGKVVKTLQSERRDHFIAGGGEERDCSQTDLCQRLAGFQGSPIGTGDIADPTINLSFF